MRELPEHGHEPVMVREVLGFLNPQPGETVMDCTAGRGGHAIEIAKRLSPGGTLIALDVQPDGSLTHQRVIARMPGGGGDGSTVDSQGRVYVTGYHGVRVFEPNGHYDGTIPAPYDLISSAFAGPDKKTLFVVALVAGRGGLIDEIWTIPTIAQGYMGRAK